MTCDLCPFVACKSCQHQGGKDPRKMLTTTPGNAPPCVTIGSEMNSGPGGATNTVIPGPNPCEGGAMDKDNRPRDHRGHFRKAAVPQAVRREVAIRAGGIPGKTMPATCNYCGARGSIYWPNRQPGIPGAWVAFPDLELDHVIPEYKGGPNTADNIVLACRPCNRRKGHR